LRQGKSGERPGRLAAGPTRFESWPEGFRRPRPEKVHPAFSIKAVSVPEAEQMKSKSFLAAVFGKRGAATKIHNRPYSF
jgi:hypothetical protein